MFIGYTLWREMRDLESRIKTLWDDKLVDFFVVVFPFWVGEDRETGRFKIKLLTGKPFLKLPQIVKVLQIIKEIDAPYWLKIQYHPMPRTLPPGAIPEWWPGYVDFKNPTNLRIFDTINRSLGFALSKFCGRIASDLPMVVIPGVELASIVNKIDLNSTATFIRSKLAPHPIRVIYGANFWQPIREKLDGLISLVYRWGYGPFVVSRIMKGTPYERADSKLLADIAYHARIKPDRIRDLDAIGLSAYFYPSMQQDVEPYEAMQKFRYWYIRFSYPEIAVEWANKLNKRLVITETGVIYNSPIANDQDAVIDWFLDSFQIWWESDIHELVIWDEVNTDWVIEALKRWRQQIIPPR